MIGLSVASGTATFFGPYLSYLVAKGKI